MIRNFMILSCVGILAFANVANAANCKGCEAVAKAGEGFHCDKGKIYGVELASQKLYKALEGHKINKAEMKCDGCKTAAQINGKCKHCNVSMAHGQAFHSNVSYALAMGTPVSTENTGSCVSCKTAHKDNGFCTACKIGFVAHRSFTSEDAYKTAKAALATLVKAASTAKLCETCAVAMVTDGKCNQCEISFKDGKKVKG